MDEEVPPSTQATRGADELEAISTISRVPGNANYYEKGGLRTEGDGYDHTQQNEVNLSFVLVLIGCAIGLSSSQVYALLYLTIGTVIAVDLGRPDLFVWMLSGGILAMGSLAPFIGPLADLLGRRFIFLAGYLVSIIGCVVCSATPTAEGFVAGQVLLGLGAVTLEMLAIAVTSEIVPTSKRPSFLALILLLIIPWSPGTYYAGLLIKHSWRWIGLVLAIWNLIGLMVIFFGYHPGPRVNALGRSRKHIVQRIDFVGGFGVFAGILIFLYGLNSGGITSPWKSARVLAPLVLGIVVLIMIAIYEHRWAPYPLFPRRMIHSARPFWAIILVIFSAGVNYVPLVVFWPVEAIAVFQGDRETVSVWTIPIGACILGGAIFSALLLATFRKGAQWTILLFCCVQTVATGCLAIVNKDNVSSAWAPLVLALFATGGALVPSQLIITTITPDDLIASVAAFTLAVRAQAQVIGIGIFYNEFEKVVTKRTYEYVVPAFIKIGFLDAETRQTITSMMSSLTSIPLREFALAYPQLKDQISYAIVLEATTDVFAAAFKHMWYITIAFGVFACVASAFIGDLSQYMDNHVAVRM
ncbi:MFS general substrate transporter [Myriangium duriaei CBS 260.36]|uniref:MFS general substrate transporter n=1 Tax=Myriangium duriaei CBS 260.36 TaxID=1168546 RepID=A0A9P4J432_9PEZI|nr:MFS general substrate transporter [Myriangium duriaei CBS 260.36]